MAVLKVIGLMSGTSLDGVDAAMIETDGVDIRAFGPTAFLPYSDSEQAELRRVLGQWPDAGARVLAGARDLIDQRHLEAIALMPGADLVGFHGQTLAHDPVAGRTHQLGDGARISQRSGLPVVWDFRSDDMRQGGQGAPLVPFFHHALARRAGCAGMVAFLNIGGVSNITFVDPGLAEPDSAGALLAFDIGPGNAILNDFMRLRLGLPFDRGGALAASGTAHVAIIEAWAQHPFFQRKPPKSLDRNDFHGLLHDVAHLSSADGAATLTEFSAECVAKALAHAAQPVKEIFLCGGGRHNSWLTRQITARTRAMVRNVDALGFDGDAMEAQAFGFLAARVLRGLPTTAPSTTGCKAATSGGIISRPVAVP